MLDRVRVNILAICVMCFIVTVVALCIDEIELAGVGLGGMLGFGSQILDNEAKQ